MSAAIVHTKGQGHQSKQTDSHDDWCNKKQADPPYYQLGHGQNVSQSKHQGLRADNFPHGKQQGFGISQPHHRKYQHVVDIGTGSFGKAVLVKDLTAPNHAKNLYVMKVIDIVWLSTKERQDAINEVKVLSRLKHPYIVSYKESFVENGRVCIVMEYADGGDLYEAVLRQKKKRQFFTESQIVRWITQITLALKYMHDNLVLHRDLKTQNLFLTCSGRLCVGDFGIAKLLGDTTEFARTQVGTPYYLSPEICQNQPYTWASDIWALGCIIYELATLTVPFHASSIGMLLHKITQSEPPPFPARYTKELQQLYLDCLNRDWKLRPTAAQILQRSLVRKEMKAMMLEQYLKERQSFSGNVKSLNLCAKSSSETFFEKPAEKSKPESRKDISKGDGYQSQKLSQRKPEGEQVKKCQNSNGSSVRHSLSSESCKVHKAKSRTVGRKTPSKMTTQKISVVLGPTPIQSSRILTTCNSKLSSVPPSLRQNSHICGASSLTNEKASSMARALKKMKSSTLSNKHKPSTGDNVSRNACICSSRVSLERGPTEA